MSEVPSIPPMPAAMTGVAPALEGKAPEDRLMVLRRSAILAIVAFLTLIDLFGSQALLPALTKAYGVSPAAMGFAVNASTIGMAAASLFVAVLSHRLNRKRGIWVSLMLLSVPTMLLGIVDDLTAFTLLRILQGVFMSAAFALTLTYLSEECEITAIGGAMAAYITGNVASNLFGRMLASGVADNLGLAESFYVFAALNLFGAFIAYRFIGARSKHIVLAEEAGHAGPLRMLRVPELRRMFAVGFLLLFVFVSVFTYVNFIISEPPFSLPQISIGLVYLVFAPAILTTPLAAGATRRFGARASFGAAMAASLLGLALLMTASLVAVLIGLTLVGAGLFFAQSVATASVGRAVTQDHAVANGLYLAFYYIGGITGAFVMGQVFGAAGWTVTMAVLAALTALAALLGLRLPGPGSARVT